MNRFSEQIREEYQRNQMDIARQLMKSGRMQDELRRYLISVRDDALLKEFYGLDSSRIVPQSVEIYLQKVNIILPKEPQIYLGNSRNRQGFDIGVLSHEELSFLIQAFIPDKVERDYIVSLVFYKNNFLTKTTVDIMDYLQYSEELFRRTFSRKQQILQIVSPPQSTSHTISEGAANDTFYTPLVDRIEDMEPGYFDYIHKIYQERLHFVESVFCQTVAALSEDTDNHLWALDPENYEFKIPKYLQNKVNLIRSICEFHVILDTHFPQLHHLLKGTVRSWILIYKGFSSPSDKLRKSDNN